MPGTQTGRYRIDTPAHVCFKAESELTDPTLLHPTSLPNFTIRKKKLAICFDNVRLVTPPMHYRSWKLQVLPDTPQPHVVGSFSSTISLATSPNHPGHIRARIREPNPFNAGEIKGQAVLVHPLSSYQYGYLPQADASGPGLPPLLLDPERMVPRPTMPHVSQPQLPPPR